MDIPWARSYGSERQPKGRVTCYVPAVSAQLSVVFSFSPSNPQPRGCSSPKLASEQV